MLLKAPKKTKRQSENPIQVPFTVLVDDREKAPYLFQGLRAGSKRARRPLVVTWKRAHLKTGDYSIEGYEDRIAIERKSLTDLFSTLAGHRDRFKREHERLAEMDFGAVVIEANWWRVFHAPPPRSGLKPASVWGTWRSWRVRYEVTWEFVEDRRLAERATLDLLWCWWEKETK